MSNIVNFAKKWHERSEEGIRIFPEEAARFINILTDSHFRTLSSDFEMDNPGAWAFLSSIPPYDGYFDAYKQASRMGITKKSVVEAIECLQQYKMIELSPRPELKNWIRLTPYGTCIKNCRKSRSRSVNNRAS